MLRGAIKYLSELQSQNLSNEELEKKGIFPKADDPHGKQAFAEGLYILKTWVRLMHDEDGLSKETMFSAVFGAGPSSDRKSKPKFSDIWNTNYQVEVVQELQTCPVPVARLGMRWLWFWMRIPDILETRTAIYYEEAQGVAKLLEKIEKYCNYKDRGPSGGEPTMGEGLRRCLAACDSEEKVVIG